MKSEIFEAYAKIAEEKGLISKDAPDKAKKILEKNPRADSLDISAISALYGVKPETPKDMSYKDNIMEIAHPNAVIISPSYDKLNGLVENNIERQNIIRNILDRDPTGNHTGRKYAEQDFLLSLVRLGNSLDQKNKDSLRKLSDTCLTQVSNKSFKKQAFLIPLVIGLAATIGALYAQQHMSFADEGLKTNYNKLMAEINDLVNSNDNWGVGYKYSNDFESILSDFKDKLTNFYDLYNKIYPLIQSLQKPRTIKELIDLQKQSDTSSVITAYHTLRAATENLLPYLQTIKQDFSSESYKATQIEDEGFLSSLVDKMQVLHGGKGLVADDFDDVVRAIDPFEKSISDILNILKNSESVEHSVQSKIEQASAQSQSEFGSTMNQPSSSPSSSSPTSSPVNSGPTKPADFDSQIGDLDHELSNL